jgi:hypothetical protein
MKQNNKKQQTKQTKSKAPSEKQILAKLAKLEKRKAKLAVDIDRRDQVIQTLREEVHALNLLSSQLTDEMDGLMILLPPATQLVLSLGDIKKAA